MVSQAGTLTSDRSRHRGYALAVATLLLIWAGFLGCGVVCLQLLGRGNAFNIIDWEITRLGDELVKHTMTAPFRGSASSAQTATFFALQAQIRATQRANTSADAAGEGLKALERRRDALQLRVELRFEEEISLQVRTVGLTQPLPMYESASLVWPPVASAFDEPPHILITSPRTRIALDDTQLLRSDLSLPEQLQIEAAAETRPNTSALVDQIGGLGAYPSVDDIDSDPLGLIQTAAHEWTHDYLAFHALGARYAQSNDMTLINETVANLCGKELGTSAFDQLGLQLPRPAALPPAGALNFDATLHSLRLDVDRLLAAGQVAQAESEMNQTAARLQANGYAVRRINQAYFAFYGSYGDTGAASNPLGDEVVALRRFSPSLAGFVGRVQGIARPSDLGRLLRLSSGG